MNLGTDPLKIRFGLDHFCRETGTFTRGHRRLWPRVKLTAPNFLLLLFLLFFPCFLILVSFYSSHPSFWEEKFGQNHRQTETGTLINYKCVGLFMHRFCTKNGACFFRLALSECSRYTKCIVLWERSIHAELVAYLKS